MLQGIMGQVQGNLGNTGLTGAESGALNSVEANAANGNPYAPQIATNASSLLSGGGAMNNAGKVNNAYQNYYNQTNPLASNTNYNPYSSPGFSDAVNTLTSDITNNTNGAFAAAGRDFSGANSMALGRGLTQGIAPVIQAQYDQNVKNQQGAAGNLYAAGNTTAGTLSGMQQQGLANTQAGTQAANDALTAQNYGANQTLAAEAQRRGIPVQALGLLANIGIPIAGLGSQSTGSSTGTQQMSGAQQFQTIMSGIGSLIPKGTMNFNF
jgi:hypothetical protein